MLSIPTAYPEGEDGPAITIISGESHGVTSPVRPVGGCWYFDIKFKKAGQSIFQPIRASLYFIKVGTTSDHRCNQRADGPHLYIVR